MVELVSEDLLNDRRNYQVRHSFPIDKLDHDSKRYVDIGDFTIAVSMPSEVIKNTSQALYYFEQAVAEVRESIEEYHGNFS